MKITNEELQQIIREELEAVLDEGMFGKKGRQLSPTKYDYDKKDKQKRRQDLKYKGDDYDIDDINQKIAKKFGGTYKKLKEEEGPVEKIIASLMNEPSTASLNKLFYQIRELPEVNPAQKKAKKSAYANVGSAIKNIDTVGATNQGRANFIKRAIDSLRQYDRADSVDVQDPTME